jgi:hypothetical protein
MLIINVFFKKTLTLASAASYSAPMKHTVPSHLNPNTRTNEMKKISLAREEQDGCYAIQTIESLLAEIMRRHGYPAERARESLVHFAKGYCDYAIQSQRSAAVLTKIFAMAKHLLRNTCLNADEIDDLILMVAC